VNERLLWPGQYKAIILVHFVGMERSAGKNLDGKIHVFGFGGG